MYYTHYTHKHIYNMNKKAVGIKRITVGKHGRETGKETRAPAGISEKRTMEEAASHRTLLQQTRKVVRV